MPDQASEPVEKVEGGAMPDNGGGPVDPPGEQVIVGPVVTGPTIPVVPAGADYEERHSELADPTTVPRPGSVGINTDRALREDTRRPAAARHH